LSAQVAEAISFAGSSMEAVSRKSTNAYPRRVRGLADFDKGNSGRDERGQSEHQENEASRPRRQHWLSHGRSIACRYQGQSRIRIPSRAVRLDSQSASVSLYTYVGSIRAQRNYSTVTLFARFLGWSTSVPLRMAQ
jgi:hypothetical protein